MNKYLPNKYIGGALVASIILLSIPNEEQVSTTEIRLAPTQAPRNNNEQQEYLTRIQEGKDYYVRVLHEVTRGDPEGERLALWHDQRALYTARPSGDGDMYAIPVSDIPVEPVIHVGMFTPAELAEIGAATTDFHYSPSGRRLRVLFPGTISDAWSGSIMVHELVHATEYDSGALAVSRNPDEDADAEVRAYTVQMRLLDRVVDGRALELLDRVLDTRGLSPDARAPSRTRDIPTPAEGNEFSALFEEPGTGTEFATRMWVMTLALSLRYADRNELGSVWKRERYQALDQMFQEAARSVGRTP